MVASTRPSRELGFRWHVSIPFIAGQWSLQLGFRWHGGSGVGSQSPSLRGSGRFEALARLRADAAKLVSIPFIAGQWSLPADFRQHHRRALQVSIPFIAGQWSLHRKKNDRPPPHGVSIPFIAGQWSLPCLSRRRRSSPPVSIPFIAGQWSLPAVRPTEGRALLNLSQSPSLRGSGRFVEARREAEARAQFQSPSLRGSGRFRTGGCWKGTRTPTFQSPSLRGSGRFFLNAPRRMAEGQGGFNPLHCGAVVASGALVQRLRHIALVSIPFIAGQWSLPPEGGGDPFAYKRFNPLHCGAVVASEGAGRDLRRGGPFQSPSLRGSGRFTSPAAPPSTGRACFNPLHCGAVVASRTHRGFTSSRYAGFNPLHCGAVVASRPRRRCRRPR